MNADIEIQRTRTGLTLLRWHSDRGRDWIAQHTHGLYWGPALIAPDAEAAQRLAESMTADGLIVQ